MSEEIVDQEVTEVVDDGEVVEEAETGKPDPYAGLTQEEAIDRLKKAEALIIKNKKAPPIPVNNPNPPDTADIPEWGKTLLSTEEKRQFGQTKGFSNETVDAVFKYNGGAMPSDEQLQSDPAIRAIVSDFEGRRRVAANTPKGGSVPTYKGKAYSDIVTDPGASKADKQAAFESAQKKHNIR